MRLSPHPAVCGHTLKDARVRLKLFRARVANLFAGKLQYGDQFLFKDLLELVNEGLATDALFGTQEATLACEAMGEQNDLMLSGDIVYKI